MQQVKSILVDISVRMKIVYSSRLNKCFSWKFSAGYMDRYDPVEASREKRPKRWNNTSKVGENSTNVNKSTIDLVKRNLLRLFDSVDRRDEPSYILQLFFSKTVSRHHQSINLPSIGKTKLKQFSHQ